MKMFSLTKILLSFKAIKRRLLSIKLNKMEKQTTTEKENTNNNIKKVNKNSQKKRDEEEKIQLLSCDMLKFSSLSSKWEKQTEKNNEQKMFSFQNNKEITFISYNIWFDPYNWDNRCLELLNLLASRNADIVCLQEVTNDFYSFLLSSSFVQSNYSITYLPDNQKNWYDVVILSRYYCLGYVKKFVSRMGRRHVFIVIEDTSQNVALKIGTVHLESLNNSNIRETQLFSAYGDLENDSYLSSGLKTNTESKKYSFLMGDFNFTERETPLISESGFWDVGNSILQQEYEKQEDRRIKEKISLSWSTMKAMKGYPAWRPDRFTVKTNTKSFYVKKFEIIGRDPINILDKNNPVDTPSDHYGLYAECVL